MRVSSWRGLLLVHFSTRLRHTFIIQRCSTSVSHISQLPLCCSAHTLQRADWQGHPRCKLQAHCCERESLSKQAAHRAGAAETAPRSWPAAAWPCRWMCW